MVKGLPQMSSIDIESTQPVRHILSLSGGKDSSALAVYMRDRVPTMEYVFCDTAKELPETYEYIDRLAAYLGKGTQVVATKELAKYRPNQLAGWAARNVIILRNHDDEFDRLLEIRRGYLPSPRMRWCTELLKLRPFEQYVGDDPVISYIGIRYDEANPDRKGYISHKPNVEARYPFVDAQMGMRDIERLLEESGLGMPDYYRWRSRSGCYFCFFQQRIEWVGLLENHPDLFECAAQYEKDDPATGGRYTWVQRESLRELSTPQRVAEIREEHARRISEAARWHRNRALADVLSGDDSERACLICSL
jgi:hypothetical protein